MYHVYLNREVFPIDLMLAGGVVMELLQFELSLSHHRCACNQKLDIGAEIFERHILSSRNLHFHITWLRSRKVGGFDIDGRLV